MVDDSVREQVLKQILDERDELLLARLEVRRRLKAVQKEDAVLRRALFDRRAAGRVFKQTIAVPQEDEAFDSREALDRAMQELRSGSPWLPGQSVPTPVKTREGNITQEELFDHPQPGMRISDLIMEYLKQVGAQGAGATEIRNWLENVHGIKTHEKTPGMTLYRLSKEGLVSRMGRTWFLASALAEKGNPGSETPGQSNVFE